MTVCYYAHPRSLYGTPQEAADVALLESLGFEVLNPNTPEHQAACRAYANPMDYFVDLARREAQVLAFRAFPDLRIGAGILVESRLTGLPTFELPQSFASRALSIVDTGEYNRRHAGGWEA